MQLEIFDQKKKELKIIEKGLLCRQEFFFWTEGLLKLFQLTL